MKNNPWDVGSLKASTTQSAHLYTFTSILYIAMALLAQTIKLDTTFDSFKELKHVIKLYAIQNNFKTRTVKSESRRYRVRCKAEGCPWVQCAVNSLKLRRNNVMVW